MNRSLLSVLVGALAAFAHCFLYPTEGIAEQEIIPTTPKHAEPIKPIPLTVELDAPKVALGKALFHEPKLSRNNTISCASCHDLQKAGIDQRKVAIGINRAPGSLNVPTVFNSAANFRQFWDGRARTLEDQATDPVHNPVEMDSNWDEVLNKLRATPAYLRAFSLIYADGLTAPNIRNAIAEFERSLITPNSRFDRYLRGDENALTANEKEGYRRFKSLGCASCHQGVNAGGNMFETLGTMADYFGDRGGISKADFGRFNTTGREEDRFVFKVPSLRNVSRTAPYLHDGTAETLEEAVSVMSKYQLGRSLSREDIDRIVQFLGTLTGEYEGKSL